MRRLHILLLLLLAAPLSASNLARDFKLELALGGPATTIVHKYGSSDSIDIADSPAVISGLESYWQPIAAETVRIKAGGDANDTAAGTGCQEVTIVGLDGSFDELEETVATAGASASSATTGTFIRVFRAYCSVSGTYVTSNTGNITIEEGDSGSDIALIVAAEGQTEIAAYTVPNGMTCAVVNFMLSIDGTKTATIQAYFTPNVDDVTTPFTGAKRIFTHLTGLAGFVTHNYEYPAVFAAKTDIVGYATVPANSTSVSADFELVCR